MIQDIKRALEQVANDATWAKGRAAMDDNAPVWLAALVEYYEAAEAWRSARYETPESWNKWVAARKKLERE